MSKLIWLGMIVGSAAGGALPTLWGADAISFAGLIGGTVGGIVGIALGYRLGKNL